MSISLNKKIPFVKTAFVKKFLNKEEEIYENTHHFPSTLSNLLLINRGIADVWVLLGYTNQKKEHLQAEELFNLMVGETISLAGIHVDSISFCGTANEDGTMKDHEDLEVVMIAGRQSQMFLDG